MMGNPRIRAPRAVQVIGANVALALAYFGAARLGLDLASTTPSVTAIWAPTGIALAALVFGGRALVPGVLAGAFLANVTTDVPLYTTLGITIGNTLEAVVGAALFNRLGGRADLGRLRDVLVLVVVAVTSTTVSASIGVASLHLGDAIADDTASVWRLWWLGDIGGDLLVAPLLLVAVSHWPYRELPGRAVEGLVLLAGLTATCLLAFRSMDPIAYLVFPFLIWAALRFWQPGATAAALLTTAIAVAITANGDGQFVDPSEDESLLLAQTYSAVVGLTALILAVISSERARAERASRSIAHQLQAGLLPRSLAEIPGIETAAWYDAGAQDQEVGGDFYDLFQVREGEWVAVVGDVCGRGPESAALTALARHTLRAVYEEPMEPSEALTRLNRAILAEDAEGRFITAVCARITRRGSSHQVTISSGGHPYPLLATPDGEVREVKARGALLGVVPDPELVDQRIEFEPGSALVMFTDGVIEHPGTGNGYGVDWLRTALERCASANAREIATALRRAVDAHESRTRDDRALLVVTVPR